MDNYNFPQGALADNVDSDLAAVVARVLQYMHLFEEVRIFTHSNSIAYTTSFSRAPCVPELCCPMCVFGSKASSRTGDLSSKV